MNKATNLIQLVQILKSKGVQINNSTSRGNNIILENGIKIKAYFGKLDVKYSKTKFYVKENTYENYNYHIFVYDGRINDIHVILPTCELKYILNRIGNETKCGSKGIYVKRNKDESFSIVNIPINEYVNNYDLLKNNTTDISELLLEKELKDKIDKEKIEDIDNDFGQSILGKGLLISSTRNISGRNMMFNHENQEDIINDNIELVRDINLNMKISELKCIENSSLKQGIKQLIKKRKELKNKTIQEKIQNKNEFYTVKNINGETLLLKKEGDKYYIATFENEIDINTIKLLGLNVEKL